VTFKGILYDNGSFKLLYDDRDYVEVSFDYGWSNLADYFSNSFIKPL